MDLFIILIFLKKSKKGFCDIIFFMKKRKIVLVDMDGVIADFKKSFLKEVDKRG